MRNKAFAWLMFVVMVLLCGIIFTGAALIHYANAGERSPQETFRDASGRTIGTATRSGNQTIFRDSRGATTGSATMDSTGNTVFRDASGRTTGTSTGGNRR